VLAAYVGLPPARLRFAREARGKPQLVDVADGLAFNLSHSHDQGLLAVSRLQPLGADIEVQRPMSDLDALARSHFTAAELKAWGALPHERRQDGFFAAWTRKEAYVKALGAGLAVPLDSFEVALHPDQPAALRSVAGSAEAATAWTLWAARPTAASWAAMAVHFAHAEVRTFSLRQIDVA
jgi:4'-phosphopantetheinyl transferase